MPVTRTFPCRLASLEKVRALVAVFFGKHGVNDLIIGEIELAVSEACTNIINHSGLTAKDTFTLRADRDGNSLSVTLVDAGRQYDFQHLKTVQQRGELSARRPRSGMGVYIIRQLIDAVMYNYLPGGRNELRLVKNL